MTDTANLGLPFIEGSQAQKHIIHNEALRILDAVIQVAVLDTDRTAPPASPDEGDRHIVAVAPTGAWAGRAAAIATWEDGAWRFLVPHTGWIAWSIADDILFVFDGAVWRDLRDLPISLDNTHHIGVNTSADAFNRLSVRSNAMLLNSIATGDGGSGDVRLQISKEGVGNAASVVFSNAFSGRAEFGLIGSDAFKLKVSPDGSSFAEAFIIDQASGNLSLPRGLSLSGVISPAQIMSDQNDYAPGGHATASVYRINSDASRKITGLGGGIDGRLRLLVNAGSFNIVLSNADTLSAAANRFAFAASLTLTPAQAALLWYDATANRWKLVGTNAPADGTLLPVHLDVASIAKRMDFRAAIQAAPFDALASSGIQINGAMDHSQENGSGVVSLVSGTAAYVIDQWRAKFATVSTLACSAQQVTPPGSPSFGAAFRNALQLKATTGLATLANNDYAYVETLIEGNRSYRLCFGASNAAPVSIGFWVYATIAGTMAVSLTNSAGNRSIVKDVAIASPGTWEYKAVTFSGDTTGAWLVSNGVGLIVRFCFGAGAALHTTPGSWTAAGPLATSATTNFVATTNNIAAITGVVVVPGLEMPPQDRSPWIMRAYDAELSLCHRYLWIDAEPRWLFAESTSLGVLQNRLNLSVRWPVVMRSSPTVTFPTLATIGIATPDLALLLPSSTGCVMTAVSNSASGTRMLMTYSSGSFKADARLS